MNDREAEELRGETEDVLISAAQNLLEAKKRLERAQSSIAGVVLTPSKLPKK